MKIPNKLEALFTVVIATMTLGCSGSSTNDDDTNTSGDTGGGDGDGAGLPGDVLECCFMISYGSALPCNAVTCEHYVQEACLPQAPGTSCVDPAEADNDGNGTLEIEEIQLACQQVCLDQNYDGAVSLAASGLVPTSGSWDYPGGFVWNCNPALGTINSSVAAENACNPPLVGPPPHMAPTHLATLNPDGDTAVRLEVLGHVLQPTIEGQSDFAIHDCEGDGIDGGRCTLRMAGLSLELAESLSAGDYEIPNAQAVLAGAVDALVDFEPCDDGLCTGEFRFSSADGNAIALGLAWDELQTTSNGTSGQYLEVTNDGEGLGGMNDIDGQIVLDQATQGGTITLRGGGKDTMGGAFARADFMLEMDLTRVVPGPGNSA